MSVALSKPLPARGSWLGLLPNLLLVLLALVLFVSVLVMTSLPMRWARNPAEAQQFWVWGWLMAPLGWWLLMALPLCQRLYLMTALRLPGLQRLLWRGVALHLGVSVGLPLLALLVLRPPGADIPQLAAALWLGATVGLVTVSLASILPIVPLLLLFTMPKDWHQPLPMLVMGGLALALSLLVWRWQLARPRSNLWAPVGAWLEGGLRWPAQGNERWWQAAWTRLRERWLPVAAPAGVAPGTWAATSSALASRDWLAAVLGTEIQTLRQQFGWRGQYGIWLGIALTVGVLLLLTEDGPSRSRFQATMIGGILMLPMMLPGHLLRLCAPARARWAELRLQPGVPSALALERVVLRQIAWVAAERLAMLAVVAAATAWMLYQPGSVWWLMLAAQLLMVWGMSLLLSWQVWRGWITGVWGTGLLAVVASTYVGLGVGTQVGFLVKRGTEVPMLLVIWLGASALLLVLAALLGWRQRRHAQVQA